MANCISPHRAAELSRQRDRALGAAPTVMDLKLARAVAQRLIDEMSQSESRPARVNPHPELNASWIDHLLDRAPLDIE